MATVKNPEVATPVAVVAVKKTRKVVTLSDRVKTQLSTAALRNKISVEELSALSAHITKLQSLLAP